MKKFNGSSIWRHDNSIEYGDVDFDLYKISIPTRCGIQAYEGHRAMFFCWNLIKNMQNKDHPGKGCKKCEFFNTPKGA